jgi:hypothetical protein
MPKHQWRRGWSSSGSIWISLLRLADGAVSALESYAVENTARVEVANKTGVDLREHMLVHLEFGSSWHQDLILNPRLLVEHDGTHQRWTMLLGHRVLAVIRRELTKGGGT